jgi:hypothetical protein
MSLFGKLFSNTGAQADQPVSGVSPANAQVQNDEELIAVISAAIAAFEGSKVMSNLIIRKISREHGQVTVWNSAGRADCMRSRRI